MAADASALAWVTLLYFAVVFGVSLWGYRRATSEVEFLAAALPLTYLPILVVANDPEYMGDRCNGRFVNLLASIYLVILLVVAAAAIPLIIITKGGA